MNFFKTVMQVVLLFVCSSVFAEQQVLQFWEPNDVGFLADDREFAITEYTVVQTYGNDDERLYFGSLKEGDWILVTFDIVGTGRQRLASKIEILPNESVASEIRDTL